MTRHPIRHVLLFFVLVLSVFQAQSAVVIPLYDAEVAVEDRSPEARQIAFSQALSQVFDRLVGDDIWRQDPAVSAAIPRSDQWVERYAYREVIPDEGEQAEPDLLALQGLAAPRQLMLSVTFSREAVSRILKQGGYAIWEGPRPQMVAWVLQERLGGRSWVGPDDEAGQALGRQAQYWGIPLVWPQSRPEVLQQVRMAEVAGGFPDSLVAAQPAFGAEGYLVLRLRDSDGARMRLTGQLAVGQDAPQPLEAAQGEPGALMADVVRQVARVLSRRYAVVYDTAARNQIRMIVRNVGSYHAYARTLSWLDSLPPIEQVRPVELRDSTMTVELELASTPGKLTEYMALRPFLQPMLPEAEGSAGADSTTTLYYRYPDEVTDSTP
ncbi:DUF2066 domain-containing protein [Hahella sp. SMD15-11]|uniref:DUF2066 domain-containing protein n=1 Tax=Thermohahella caldifontis TaxID=3142973 RepID=A0AB39UYD3_9GAMM